jgi:hypothetical protein
LWGFILLAQPLPHWRHTVTFDYVCGCASTLAGMNLHPVDHIVRYTTTPIYQVFTDIYNWSLLVENNGTTADYYREYGVSGSMSITICAVDLFDAQGNESAVVLSESLPQAII